MKIIKLIVISAILMCCLSAKLSAGDMSNMVVLVTGGSGGIGASIAKTFHREGAMVIVSSRDKAKLDKAILVFKQNGYNNIHGIVGELNDKATAEQYYDSVIKIAGRVDILINNAGMWIEGGLLGIDEKQVNSSLDVAKGTLFLTQAVLKDWVKRKHPGSVVNIGSTSVGQASLSSPCLSYSFQKACLQELSTAMAVEMAPYGVRSNLIFLGPVGDEISQKNLSKETIAAFPLGRIARPEEVGELALFLADSKKSGWISGAKINMDGGQSAFR